MVLIGDYSWVLYVVFATLGALLACYGVALLGSYRAPRPRQARKRARTDMRTGAQQSA